MSWRKASEKCPDSGFNTHEIAAVLAQKKGRLWSFVIAGGDHLWRAFVVDNGSRLCSLCNCKSMRLMVADGFLADTNMKKTRDDIEKLERTISELIQVVKGNSMA